MGIDLRSVQAKKLIDRFSALECQGEVIDKRVRESIDTPSPQKFLVIRFKDREFERPLKDAEFDRTEIGDKVQFTPTIPKRDVCHRHLCLCVIVAIAAEAFVIWGLMTCFSRPIAFLLCVVASAWIGIAAWAKICSHDEGKLVKGLEKELQFFGTGTAAITEEPDNQGKIEGLERTYTKKG